MILVGKSRLSLRYGTIVFVSQRLKCESIANRNTTGRGLRDSEQKVKKTDKESRQSDVESAIQHVVVYRKITGTGSTTVVIARSEFIPPSTL